MVDHPECYVGPFADAGANCLTFHIEAVLGRREDHEGDVIDRIHRQGCQAGVAINPTTPAAAVDHVVHRVDLVLVMSVHPGFTGQAFIPEAVEKLRTLNPRLPTTTRLEIDGGINADNVDDALEAGADVVVAASALFGARDREATIQALRGTV